MAKVRIAKVKNEEGKTEDFSAEIQSRPLVKYTPEEGGLVDEMMGHEELYDPKNPLNSIPKKTRDMSTDNLSIVAKEELRMIIDTVYQAQHNRISAENQLRAVIQEADTGEVAKLAEGKTVKEIDKLGLAMYKYPTLAYIIENRRAEENNLVKLTKNYVETLAVGRWCMANTGVGPLLAGLLLAYFDIEKAKYPTQFWSYAGFNNNNDPWLKGDPLEYVMTEIVADNKIDNDLIAKISAYTGRRADKILKGAKDKDTGKITKTSLRKYLAKPNYNLTLKCACWKLGESFLKCKNKPQSLYGRLLNERYLTEQTKNEELAYIQEALKSLGYIFKKNNGLTKAQELELLAECKRKIESKKFKPRIGTTTKAFTYYIEGKLPPAHIIERCKRWAVKLFLSHLHTAMYLDRYGEMPPEHYVFAIAEHRDKIDPEVPYEDFISLKK